MSLTGRSVVRREAIVTGIAATLLAAVVMALNIARHGQGWMFRNDAEFFWVVARDPFGQGHMFRPIASVSGDAYRFGRPLYPFVAWVLALGRPGAVRWTMIVVDALSFGAMIGLAGELLARRGRRAVDGFAVLLVPGVWWAVVLALAEPMVVALILLTYLLYEDGRRWALFVTGALLLLARESAGLALVPLVVADVNRRGWRSGGRWLFPVLPLALWWVWVRVRVGQWPFLDRSEARAGALDVPLRGYFRFSGGVHAAHLIVFALAAVTVGASVWVWRRRRWFPLAEGALLFGLLLIFLGPNATRFPGEVMRLMVPAHVLIVLVVLGTGHRMGAGGLPRSHQAKAAT